MVTFTKEVLNVESTRVSRNGDKNDACDVVYTAVRNQVARRQWNRWIEEDALPRGPFADG